MAKPGSVTPHRKVPYLIGSDKFAGISKLVEECGEVLQVIGKLMGFGKFGIHWDGKPIKRSLEEEIADVLAAVDFVIAKNHLNRSKIEKRRKEKYKKFSFWHKNVQKDRDPRDGGKDGVKTLTRDKKSTINSRSKRHTTRKGEAS